MRNRAGTSKFIAVSLNWYWTINQQLDFRTSTLCHFSVSARLVIPFINRAISASLQYLIISLIMESTRAKNCSPALHTKNFSGSRMVDYAICLKADLIEPKFNQIINILRLEPPDLHYISYTAFEPVRFWPIAVGIESKVAYSNETEATTQFSVWVMAHFKLQKESSSVPVLLRKCQCFPWLKFKEKSGSLRWQFGATRRYHQIFSSFCTWLINSKPCTAEFQLEARTRFSVFTNSLLLQQWVNTEYRDWLNRILGATST